MQRDGRIVAVGETSVDSSLAAYRRTSQGKPDDSFDEDGARGIDAGGSEKGYAVALQADGKIVVAGVSDDGPENPLLARFDSNGKPDMMFAADGRILLDLGGYEEAYSVALQRDDKIVVGGWTGIGDDPVVWRLNRDGSPDASFGERGATIPIGLGLEWVDDVALQPDGRIVSSSERNTSNRDILVARLFGDFRPPAPPARPLPRPGGQPPANVVRCAGLRVTIVGAAGRDVIRGTRGRDVMAALGGSDTVRGLGGNDIVCAGAGDDVVIGGSGAIAGSASRAGTASSAAAAATG